MERRCWEEYLKLVAEKGDDIKTLAEQTGLKTKDLKKLKLGEIVEGTEILSLGNLLNFSGINEALNYSEQQCVDQNNCWNSSQEFAMGVKIGIDGNNYSQLAGTAEAADNMLDLRFQNVDNPQSGDIVRFANGDSNNDGKIDSKDVPPNKRGGTSHSAIFLLKNKTGMQVFTKNGSGAPNYEISYTNTPTASLEENKTMLQTYGNPTGIGTGTPFYRKKD